MAGYKLMKTISFFSAGVSSAVATKLVIDQVDRIIYTHIEDQHPDTLRFVEDCQEWFGKKVDIWHPPISTVEGACTQYGKGYINGPSGAECSRTLKRKVRMEWEKKHEGEALCYVWGFDAGEAHRCERVEKAMPTIEHIFPLVDKHITKTGAHKILKASGIKRPSMYDLGYPNNNCIGCVKGGMGYWLKIKKDFPHVFTERAKLERKVGRSCIKEFFLDELPDNKGLKLKPIVEDCGLFCEAIGL